ncbi:hypothetical protein YTPLAS18_21720 [Nitrospira sp.]|nr:hypothetical protein YTPLAS18_21720 [Nitrospira sp.]
MAQYELDVLDYWLILKKRRSMIVFSAGLVLAFTFLFTQLMTPEPMFEAAARVKYERTNAMAQQFVEGANFANPAELSTQTEVIKGFQVMERVAQDLGIVDATPTPDVRGSAEYLNTIYNLGQSIQTTREPETNIIRITAQSDNPLRAQRMANSVATAYRVENIAARNRIVTESRRFVEAQLAGLEANLEEAEHRLREFKEREGQVFLDEEAKTALSMFSQLEGELNSVTRQKEDASRQIDAVRKKASTPADVTGRIFTEDHQALLAKLNARLIELKQEWSTLLLNYTPNHPKVKELVRKIDNVKGEMIQELNSKVKTLEGREADLTVQIDRYRARYLAFPKAAIELTRLERDVKMNADLYSSLKIKHQELLIKSAEQIEEVTIIAPAVKPDAPTNTPNTPINLAVGSIMGVFLGIVMAFARESFDTSIGTIEGVEEFLKAPVLGVIPKFDDDELQEAARTALPMLSDKDMTDSVSKLVTLLQPKSLISESFRSLRTNLQFASIDRRVKSLLFTSAGLGEGKSTTVINLAITLAQEGQRVLLVDADLRRPVIHRRLGLPLGPGLQDALQGSRTWQELIHPASHFLKGKIGHNSPLGSPGLENLHVLTSGATTQQAGESMSLAKMRPLMNEMQSAYDIVLYDTPPILPVTDAVAMSSRVDGTIIVYQVGRIGRNALKRAKFLLAHAQANIMGVVLTNVKAEIAPEASFYRYEYR